MLKQPSTKFFVILFFVFFSGNLYAQNWSGVLAPTRAIDWSSAGVVGGIPSGSWSQCGSTIAAGASASTINTAIQNCAANHYVQLGAGTFNLNSGIVMKTGVAVRGMGADQTLLTFTGNTSCNGAGASVCFLGDTIWTEDDTTQPGGSQAADWTAGYAKGSTTITVANVGSNGISVGKQLYLDSAEDSSLGSGYIVCTDLCGSDGSETGANRVIGGKQYAQLQMVTVTGIPSGCSGSCKGAGPFNINITPGVYAPNITSGKSPGVWWPSSVISNSGMENVSITSSNNGGGTGITFDNATNCWVKGTRNIRNVGRSNIEITLGTHITVQDNYFYNGGVGGSTQYDLDFQNASDVLVQNNIFQYAFAPVVFSGPNAGDVIAYNLAVYEPAASANYNSPMIWSHYGGCHYNLYEGNAALGGMVSDTYHGNANMVTAFRNYFRGQDTSTKTDNTVPVGIWSFSRYHNIIGNVLGLYGSSTTYANNPGYQSNWTIYDLGGGTKGGSDSQVGATLMRWGNYDVVTGAVRWSASEVPTGLSDYPNTVPSTQTLPASFYLSQKPDWWPSGKAWPPIGPDVTGGNIANLGGHAYTIPAQDCYANVMGGPAAGTGGVLSFNASACYPSSGGGGSGINPPSNLRVVQ